MKMELLKAALAMLVSVLTLAFGWIVGERLTVTWNLFQKRRETEIENVHQFHLVYGEFRELSKTWRLIKKDQVLDEKLRPDVRWDLLTRACVLESKLESINIKLASERCIPESDLLTLGLFRQAIQRLRESIRDDELTASSGRGLDYEYFNDLAARVSVIIASPTKNTQPDADLSSSQLFTIAGVTLEKFKGAVREYSDKHPGSLPSI